MGEEKREESKAEEKKEGKQDETNKEEEPAEIVLKVDMHCEACARKVARTLKGFEGVEEVATEYKASKVVVKGKTADPIKVTERLKKKSGRKVELISPLPKPPSKEEKKEEIKEEPKEEKKKEPPAVITVLLKVHMHCEACAQVLQKRIRKIQVVEAVETDVRNHQVIVKGVVDPTNLVDCIHKRTRKHVFIVKDEENKEEEKKEDEGKGDDEGKGEVHEGKGDGEDKGEDDDKKMSDNIKRSEYYPSNHYSEFAYPPQIFSDENPNACSLM